MTLIMAVLCFYTAVTSWSSCKLEQLSAEEDQSLPLKWEASHFQD